MQCPGCKKTLSPQARKCPKCGTRIVRKSDKIARGMTLSGRFAMACGGLLIFLAILLFIYGEGGGFIFEAVLIVLGLLLLFIGRKID